jgi:hypothetical protein
MSDPLPSPTPLASNDKPAPSTPKKRSGWLPVCVLLTVFLIGFVPTWLKSGRLTRELVRTQTALRLETIQLTFANAALDTRRGDYEPARQGMANFFTLVTTEQDRGLDSALPANAADELKLLLAQRDDFITLLARGDAASAERLATAYADFRKALGK